MVGTARRIFDMALAYAKEREQFDVPIGSFQAIQHKLADMSLALERATAAVHYAAMTVDADDPDRAKACHVAKAAAGEAARRILKDGIQIHGGIGYTWEHDLHLYPAPGHRRRVPARHHRLAPRPPRRPAHRRRPLIPAARSGCEATVESGRDRADVQNRQHVEPGVSSAVPTAVAVRGLTS